MNKEIQQEPSVPQDDFAQFMETAARYWKPVALGVAVLLLVTLGTALYVRNARMKTKEAEEMLAASRTTRDLETLIERHPSSPVVPPALLRDAKLYFDSGHYSAALDKYGEFLKRFPEHPMATVAAMGEIECAEAGGDAAGALPRYAAFAAKHPDHYLAPEALMAEGRCLEQLGRADEARKVYEDFLAEKKDNTWAPMFRERVRDLDRKAARAARRKLLNAAGTSGRTNAPALGTSMTANKPAGG